MNIHIDCSVAEDCINTDSYGEICIHCGCCASRNNNYKDRIFNCYYYYKDKLEEEKHFELWSEDPELRKWQERNVNSDIRYYKRKIRFYKKLIKICR